MDGIHETRHASGRLPQRQRLPDAARHRIGEDLPRQRQTRGRPMPANSQRVSHRGQRTGKMRSPLRPRSCTRHDGGLNTHAAPGPVAFFAVYEGRVSSPLPRLRADLDFMPSPVEDRPGLLIRDSFRYSDNVLIIPPPLVQCLTCFDGQQTALDLRAMLVETTGELQVGDLETQLVEILARSGFREEETFLAMKEQRQREFAAADVRTPSHAGSAYPEDREELRQTMDRWMEPAST